MDTVHDSPIDQIDYFENEYQRSWRKNGQLHRDGDLPALILPSGLQIWFKNGIIYREGGLPGVERTDGLKVWVKHCEVEDTDSKGKIIAKFGQDLMHRDNDLPALILPNGTQFWAKEGEIKRENGNPVVKANGGMDDSEDENMFFSLEYEVLDLVNPDSYYPPGKRTKKTQK